MTTTSGWTVHPNRTEIGPDRPGRNGHFRVLREAERLPEETCLARVVLPAKLAHAADNPDGSVTFAGPDWAFVVGAAYSFAERHVQGKVVPPFGFRIKGVWQWWDGSTTKHCISEGPDAQKHVRRYIAKQFPGAVIELSDLR